MAIFVDDHWRMLIDMELDQKKDLLWRIRFLCVSIVLMLCILSGGFIMQVFYAGRSWLEAIVPMLAGLGMLIPLRLAIQQYFGLVFPFFNFHKRSWIFKSPTFIGVRALTEDEDIRINEWLAEHPSYDVYESRHQVSHVDNNRFFLFKDPKQAMMFKLSVG